MDGLLHIVTMLWIDILKYYGVLLDTTALLYNHTNDYNFPNYMYFHEKKEFNYITIAYQ